jgi:hypothetical protein
MRCILGVCSRTYALSPDDEEEGNVVEMYVTNAGILTKSQHLTFMGPCIVLTL